MALLGIFGVLAAFVSGWKALPTQAESTIAPFTDIADENHLFPEVYQSLAPTAGGFSPTGVALFDYNQDGWLDIYLTNLKGEPNFLYRNNGDGTFTNVAAEVGVEDLAGNGTGVAAADFNNNGWPDLYVGNQGTRGDGLDYRSGGDQGNINRLLLNVEGPDGERAFEDVTETAGVGDPRSATTIAAADVNGNGLLDIYVGNFGGFDFQDFGSVDPDFTRNPHRNVLYLNQGINEDGVPIFEDVTDAAGVAGPNDKSRDLDGNPITHFDPDLVDAEGNPVGDDPGELTHAVLFTDVTGNGRQDLLTGDDSGVVTVYRNDGDTTDDGVPNFTDISRFVGINQVGAWMGLASADIDGDGNLDYFATNFGNNVVGSFGSTDVHRFRWGNSMNTLFRNDGTRELPGIGTVPILPNVANAIRVEPSRALPPIMLDARNVDPLHEPLQGLEAYEFGFGATFFDFENNGTPDLYWQGSLEGLGLTPTWNPGRLLRNNGDSTFRDITIEAQALTIKDFPWERVGDPDFDTLQFVIDNHLNNTALAAGDLNNDGYVDLVVPIEGTPDRPGPLFILMNNNAGNDWVKVRTTGTESNRDGVGAKVTLTVRGTRGPVFKEQVQEVRVGSSYLATEEKDLVFGLGHGAGSLTLRVEWPSGRLDVYDNVRKNTVFEAVEGEGRSG